MNGPPDTAPKNAIRSPSDVAQWFGHYSWGHNGGKWTNNEVHDNYGYGFDPHDDSDNVEISGNKVYNNGWHGISESHNITYPADA